MSLVGTPSAGWCIFIATVSPSARAACGNDSFTQLTYVGFAYLPRYETESLRDFSVLRRDRKCVDDHDTTVHIVVLFKFALSFCLSLSTQIYTTYEKGRIRK